jgi:hypothetical protein
MIPVEKIISMRSAKMARVSVPYYVVKQRRNGERKGYWQPTKAMMALGARLIPCGTDGPEAWAKAAKAYAEWKAGKRKDAARSRPRFRDGTIAAAFAEYRATEAWKDKSPRTREDWLRGWKYVEPAFGDVRPSLVTMAQLSKFRSMIAANKSTREAHRAIKIWRALWNVMCALKYCNEKDPSLGFQNHAAQARQAFWEFDEVRRLCRRSWEESYYGLAAVIAVAWDTSMSPVDVRCLRPQDRRGDAFVLKRAKTGKEIVGTLTGRSRRVLAGYLAKLGVEVAAGAPIFRNRSSRPYSKDTLGGDFRDIRAMVFGEGERRTIADMRRSGTIEAKRGGATKEAIGEKLGNAFATSKFINDTYGSTVVQIVREVDDARRRARTKERAG